LQNPFSAFRIFHSPQPPELLNSNKTHPKPPGKTHQDFYNISCDFKIVTFVYKKLKFNELNPFRIRLFWQQKICGTARPPGLSCAKRDPLISALDETSIRVAGFAQGVGCNAEVDFRLTRKHADQHGFFNGFCFVSKRGCFYSQT